MYDEFSTAASYLILQTRQRIATPSQSSSQKGTESESHRDFWVEDNWTDEDARNAEALLRENEEKCNISSLDVKDSDVKGPKGVDGIAWNKFYQDHGTRFFKDRHYFSKAFPNEFGETSTHLVESNKTLVEIGCGVGNACLPLLEDPESPWKTIHAMDISAQAIELLKSDDRFVECNKNTSLTGRSMYGYVCDIAQSFPTSCVGVSDVTTLLFCLSALDPDDMPRACNYLASSLKPGGVLVFRDYGRYDEAQMKLGTSRNKRIKANFYRKHDGTKCYYFSLEDIERLFSNAGLKTIELKYLRRAYGNKSSGEIRRRVWVQARFTKPVDDKAV